MIIKAKVKRDGQLLQIPAEQLVPGDVVSVEAGDIIPADGRLLRAATLEIAESALTGESVPVGKDTEPVEGADTPLGDRTDMVYMNTNVTRGSGEFVVTATGMATEVGHISGMLQEQAAVKTPLTRQLDELTQQILWIAGVALIVSMVLNLIRGDTFTAVFSAAVAFAIGAIPENLPAVVTTILASGTQALAKVGAIMKRLASTETLGSTSAINSDKTGTLTLNQMTAVQMAVVGRRYAIEGKGYSTDGQITRVGGQAEIPLDQFLLPMVLASDAVLADGGLIGDPTEGALVALAAKGGIDGTVITGAEFGAMSDAEALAAIENIGVIARVTPVMGVGTLGVISWAEQVRNQEIAHTMGVVTFSLYALFFSIATRNERRTVFSLDTFSDAKFVIATGVSVLTLLLTTVFGPLQKFLKTTSLDVRQWLICLAVALSIVLVCEIRKAVRRHAAPGPEQAE